MHHRLVAALGAACLLLSAHVADASNLVARVSISEQKMHVFHGGRLIHEWPVSTARRGKITPTGRFMAQWLSRNHRSSLYNNAPMPFSIFYDGNYAVHGTYETGRLGRPASAGCVRLHPDNARLLFEMARTEGLENTEIVIMY